MLLLLGAFLIPNMESGLVFLTIFGVSGVAGALSSGIVRYTARRKAFELNSNIAQTHSCPHRVGLGNHSFVRLCRAGDLKYMAPSAG